MEQKARERVQAELSARRERIVRALLVGLVLLGMVAYVPSVWLSIQVGAFGIAIVDTAAYAAVLGVLYLGRGRTRLQSWFLVLLCYSLGLFLSVVLGPVGAGPVWLGVVPAITAVLFDRTATYAMLAAVFITASGIALAAHGGIIDWGPLAENVPLWMVVAGNALLLGAGLALAVSALVRGLRESAENAARVSLELDLERDRLLATNRELKREESERRRAEEQLRQAEKLTAIGTLATGIAHDVNNLLTPVLAAPDLLRDETVPKEHRDKVLDRVEEAAVAGRQLVERILSFSRPTGAGRKPLDASVAFGEALRLLRASLPAAVELAAEFDDAGHVRLSPAEVHQVVLNLGSNAMKAMPDGGRLTFRIDQVPATAVTGWAPDPRTDRAVRIQVTDTGVGMEPSVARQAFDPFFTTDMTHGTGMGLATVHGIVASAGGAIQCTSEPGAGTTFTIYLPAVAADEEPEPRPLPSPGRAGDGHVLLVEDEASVRDVTTRALRRAGFEVTPVADAEAARRALEETAGIRAVVTDRNMPGVPGTRLAREIRQRHPAIAIVLISGLVDERLEVEAREIGIDRVLAKPFRVPELVATLHDALAARPGHDDGPADRTQGPAAGP